MRCGFLWNRKLILGIVIVAAVLAGGIFLFGNNTKNTADTEEGRLPAPEYICLRNNDTGEVLEFSQKAEEYKTLYNLVNSTWWTSPNGFPMDEYLAYYHMKWQVPKCQLEFYYPEGADIPVYGNEAVIEGIIFAMDNEYNECVLVQNGEYLDTKAYVFMCSEELIQTFNQYMNK